jgi:hypothetical protein
MEESRELLVEDDEGLEGTELSNKRVGVGGEGWTLELVRVTWCHDKWESFSLGWREFVGGKLVDDMVGVGRLGDSEVTSSSSCDEFGGGEWQSERRGVLSSKPWSPSSRSMTATGAVSSL